MHSNNERRRKLEEEKQQQKRLKGTKNGKKKLVLGDETPNKHQPSLFSSFGFTQDFDHIPSDDEYYVYDFVEHEKEDIAALSLLIQEAGDPL